MNYLYATGIVLGGIAAAVFFYLFEEYDWFAWSSVAAAILGILGFLVYLIAQGLA